MQFMKYVRTKMAVSTRSTTGAPPRHGNGWLRGRITRASVPSVSRTMSEQGTENQAIGSREPRPDAASAETSHAAFRTAWWQRLLADASTYELTRFAVLRLLALVYLAAFGSLALQLDPLLGSRGLLPIAQFLDFSHVRLGASAYWRMPTIFWLGGSDGALHAACYAGVALSLAALFGATNALIQLALWALYLSFVPPLTFEMVGPGQGYNDVLFARNDGRVQHADEFS